MILSIVFLFLMFGVIGKLIWLAVTAAWGITKIIFSLVFLPIVLVALACAGLFYIAIPVLLIIGIVAALRPAV